MFSNWPRILISTKVQIAFAAAVTAGLAIAITDPARREMWLTFILGVFGLAVAVIAAIGFEDGMQKKGTAQAGGKLTPMGTGQLKSEPCITEEQMERMKKADPGLYERIRAAMKSPTLHFAALLLPVVFLSGGCFGTSQAFRQGVARAGKTIPAEEKAYVAADTQSTAEVKAARAADADELAAAVETPESAVFERVSAAWAKVGPVYREYVKADKTLHEGTGDGLPGSRDIVLRSADEMDKLVAQEGERKRALFFGGGQ